MTGPSDHTALSSSKDVIRDYTLKFIEHMEEVLPVEPENAQEGTVGKGISKASAANVEKMAKEFYEKMSELEAEEELIGVNKDTNYLTGKNSELYEKLNEITQRLEKELLKPHKEVKDYEKTSMLGIIEELRLERDVLKKNLKAAKRKCRQLEAKNKALSEKIEKKEKEEEVKDLAYWMKQLNTTSQELKQLLQ
ncbi:hypothetical protein QR680_011163 [Steinernema hermaphroditum]|uniref:Uncharacterized protein n=1 Tax=Steinernema hermaphroditum TaxID=289476 RepID=A0AA39IRC6_9BILA|nr:hypothetical protein QR680_011163 [Steinernema hermaphroditum]